MNWQDTKVSMVANANGNTTRHEAIGQILANIRSGKWARQVEEIRDIYSEVLAMEGLEAAKEAITPYKKQLRGFLASGVFEKRVKNAKPKIPSGLLCVDLDGLGDRVAAVRAALADDPYVAAFWGSPSGAGLKVIVRIQPDLNLFYRSFCAAREHFQERGLPIDESCKDPIRLCFVSHDPNLVMRNGDVLILEPLPESEAELSQPASAVSGRDDEPISTHLETRIKMYLDKVCLAIQGDHGNKPSFRVACVLTWGFSLSFTDAKPLMQYYSEKYCQPPWSEKEIDRMLPNALKDPRHKLARGHLLGELPPDEEPEPASPSKPKPPLFVDLKSLWEGGLKPEVPTVAQVNDWLALFYKGRINEIHSEPGIGKTNVAMTAVISELRLWTDIIYFDPEDTPLGFLNRLVGLGFELTDENIARIHYLHDPSQDDIKEAIKFAEANREKISLVVYDGLAEGMSGEDLDEDKAGDVLKFLRQRLRPFAELGAAVVILDHVTKSESGRGRFSRGSGAKIGHYDGVSYSIRLVSAYSPAKAGRIEIKVAKDRNGGIGPANFVVCDVVFSPNGDGTTSYEFSKPPDSEMHSPRLLKRISDWLQANPDASGRMIRDAMHSRDEDVDNALRYLIQNGFVELIRAETRGQAHKHRLLRPYGGAGTA